MPNLASSEVLFLSQVLRANQSLIHLCNHVANETNDAQLKQLCQTFISSHDAEFHRLAGHLGGGTMH